MHEIRVSFDDDLYTLLGFYYRAISDLGGKSRTIEDFVAILVGLGLVNLGRVLTPKSEEEMRDFTISVLLGTTPANIRLLEMYKQALERGERPLGLHKD